MKHATGGGPLDALLSRPPEERRRIICSMTLADLLRLEAHFETWAHASQLPP